MSVGDFVWVDTDKDGVQDAGEPGIPGVVVTITNADGTPVTDVNGVPVTTTTTDADGGYTFGDLPPGTYTVTVVSGVPAGYDPTVTGAGTTATDSSTGSATSVTLASGQSDTTLDFGFYPAVVSVGDYVWLDTDHDGVQDAGEAGIEGVTLTLTGPGGAAVTDVLGNPVTTTVTDAAGAYTFTDLPVLPAGQYYTVTVAAPAGLYPTVTGAGTTATDSSTSSATSTDLTVDGASDPTLDFGFWEPAPVIVIVKGDDEGNAADAEADAVELAGGKAGLVFTVTNDGTEPLKDVTVSDAVVSNGTVAGLSCTFPDGSTGTTWAGPLEVGASFDCTAALTGVVAGTVHEDVATVTGTGTVTGTVVTDDNPYFGKVTPSGGIDSGSVTTVGRGWLIPVGVFFIAFVVGCAIALRRRKAMK